MVGDSRGSDFVIKPLRQIEANLQAFPLLISLFYAVQEKVLARASGKHPPFTHLLFPHPSKVLV